MLIVGLHRAERALRDGDLDEARAQITWWLHGADQATLLRLHPVAIGASLIRVAALLGMSDLALRMADIFDSVSTCIGAGRRSGHGDAPRALALAGALTHAVDGRWRMAARALWVAAQHPVVVFDGFERELYGTLVRRVHQHGHAVPSELGALAETSASWTARVWPA